MDYFLWSGLKFYKRIYDDFEINYKNPSMRKFGWLGKKDKLEGWLQGTRENKGLQLKEKQPIDTVDQYYLTIEKIKAVLG